MPGSTGLELPATVQHMETRSDISHNRLYKNNALIRVDTDCNSGSGNIVNKFHESSEKVSAVMRA